MNTIVSVWLPLFKSWGVIIKLQLSTMCNIEWEYSSRALLFFIALCIAGRRFRMLHALVSLVRFVFMTNGTWSELTMCLSHKDKYGKCVCFFCIKKKAWKKHGWKIGTISFFKQKCLKHNLQCFSWEFNSRVTKNAHHKARSKFHIFQLLHFVYFAPYLMSLNSFWVIVDDGSLSCYVNTVIVKLVSK